VDDAKEFYVITKTHFSIHIWSVCVVSTLPGAMG
jgi:hypothetical protein